MNQYKFFNLTPTMLQNLKNPNKKYKEYIVNGQKVFILPQGTVVSCVRLTINALKRKNYSSFITGLRILKENKKQYKKIKRKLLKCKSCKDSMFFERDV